MKRPIDRLLSRLDKVTGKHPRFMARCPAHNDNGPSLSVRSLDDGRVLIHCFAGCGAGAVMDSLGLSLADLYPEGSHGDFMPKHRETETRLTKTGYQYMQDEIARLRAKVNA